MISNELHTGEERPSLDQFIPAWQANNSEIHSEEQHKALDNSHTLPILNAPAHEWATLSTVLQNVYRLDTITCPDDPSPVMITLDRDLYKMDLKLEYITDKYKDKWWLLPFHTSLCTIRCFGKTIEHSGLDETWVISGLYSQVTVNQIIYWRH